MPWPIESHPRGVLLSIKAVPGGARNALRRGKEGQLRVVVTQVPEKGKANAAMLAVLAKSLGLRKSQLEIVRGISSRQKTVLVVGGDAATLTQALEQALSD